MANQNHIDCIFYSHCWAILNLEKMGINSLEETIVIELSKQSSLNIVINNSSQRIGISALLNPQLSLDGLAEYFPNIAAKIILASSQPVSLNSLSSAAQVLAYKNTNAKRIILLVNMLDACELVEAWQHADTYAIYWDLADYISPSLATLGEKLAEYGCLSSTSWKGLHFYHNSLRPVSAPEDMLTAYKEVLKQYPSLKFS